MKEDKYYLKHYRTHKIETYTYEYDKFESSMCGDQKYYVDIIFENGKFDRLDFRDKSRKSFNNNLRTKELELLNLIQEEINTIKKLK